MIEADVRNGLSKAFDHFFREERKLLESDVRGDGLSHRFALHIGTNPIACSTLVICEHRSGVRAHYSRAPSES